MVSPHEEIQSIIRVEIIGAVLSTMRLLVRIGKAVKKIALGGVAVPAQRHPKALQKKVQCSSMGTRLFQLDFEKSYKPSQCSLIQ